jgi:tetratricopeptide (TPR) repeat protein
MRTSDRIRVSAQLVRSESGDVVWANRFDRSAGDVLSSQDDLVGAIAREVQAAITSEPPVRRAAARPINPAAHDAYLKGRYFFADNSADKKRLDAAIVQFERATRLDPTYATPYAALSRAYVSETLAGFLAPKDTFPKARAAALKAVELDDQLAEAHAALAEARLWYDWNWAETEREIHRALHLNPDSIDALATSVEYAVLVTARFDQAAATSLRILTLDPLDQFSRMRLAWAAFFSRRHDDSIHAAKNLLDLYPNHVWGLYFVAQNYGAKHMSMEVKTECGKVAELLSDTYNMQATGRCGWALGVAGQTDQARRLIQTIEHPPSGIWLDPTVMGNAYGGLGDLDRAMAWYEKGIEERAPGMIYMKASVMFDASRADPRFQALIRQMNFPE